MYVADRSPLPAQRLGLVSTYPPTLCGLATFTHALRTALAAAGNDVRVVRLRGELRPDTGNPRVVASLREHDPASMANAAALLSRCDTVILQHEFGIYGGPDGEEVLALDGKTYKLTLRPNMKYSDGTPIKASDFTFTEGRLTVHLAREFGFCYGVDRAVDSSRSFAAELQRAAPQARVPASWGAMRATKARSRSFRIASDSTASPSQLAAVAAASEKSSSGPRSCQMKRM